MTAALLSLIIERGGGGARASRGGADPAASERESADAGGRE